MEQKIDEVASDGIYTMERVTALEATVFQLAAELDAQKKRAGVEVLEAKIEVMSTRLA